MIDQQQISKLATGISWARAARATLVCFALLSVAHATCAQTPPPATEPAANPATPAPSPGSATDSGWPQGGEAAPLPNALPADLLPHDLSAWGMFMSADNLVKAVMVGLAFASVLTRDDRAREMA
jgi:biopolymer transport protein ExbB